MAVPLLIPYRVLCVVTQCPARKAAADISCGKKSCPTARYVIAYLGAPASNTGEPWAFTEFWISRN